MAHVLEVVSSNIDAVIKMLNQEMKLFQQTICMVDLYRIFTTIFEKYSIKFHFVNMLDVKNIEEKINNNTKLIWAETPTNPMMNIIDVKSICDLARSKDIMVGVDNTFATPYLQNPLSLGADIVMHSVTKNI